QISRTEVVSGEKSWHFTLLQSVKTRMDAALLRLVHECPLEIKQKRPPSPFREMVSVRKTSAARKSSGCYEIVRLVTKYTTKCGKFLHLFNLKLQLGQDFSSEYPKILLRAATSSHLAR